MNEATNKTGQLHKELDYHRIEGSFGGNQEWFLGPWMKGGGCGAETAIESCIHFARHFGRTELYPFDARNLTRADYRKFGTIMRPYLSPRWTGIDRLDIFVDGFGKYLEDRGAAGIRMEKLEAAEAGFDRAREAVMGRIDRNIPVPMLVLNHKDKRFEEYVWHWFILCGYAEADRAPEPGPGEDAGCAASRWKAPDGETRFYVKTATYSEWNWIDLEALWDSGEERKGGLILYSLD